METENKLYLGDCLDVLPEIKTDSIDAIVTDPPYFLMNNSGEGFMGNKWDSLYSSKINSILCKSKEFANFVVRFFALMQVDSNTGEENTVQNNVNIEGCQKRTEKTLNVNVPSVKKSSSDTHIRSKVNISSVHGIALTKAEVLDLLRINHIKNVSPFKNLNEDALFVVPILYIIRSLKNIVATSALKSTTKKVCVDKGILLTSMEEAKIKSVIEAITGMRSERSVMPEMNTNVDTAENTVEEKRYKHIILSHTEKEEVANYLISLLYALFVIPELNRSPNSSFNEIQKRDLVYRFHKNWAIEALRVLKSGAFAFVMSSPRSDLLPLMITALRDAGFDMNFSSIYHTFATGFSKAQNLAKVAQKRNIEPQVSKKLEGGFSGFQPKPAVEVVIVAMKPIDEKTYLDQAIANRHGCTWLYDCRIPYESESDKNYREKDVAYRIQNNIPPTKTDINNGTGAFVNANRKGRFPANVLCEDDVLNDGNIRKSGGRAFKDKHREKSIFNAGGIHYTEIAPNGGSFSRYLSLDAWFAERIKLLPKEAQKTFPFMLVPKASKTEKYRNLDIVPEPSKRPSGIAYNEHSSIHSERKGILHPTMKPLKLMMWLIILGTQEGDTVLDPFMGSGTTPLAAKMTHRYYKGIELGKEFFDVAVKRLDEAQKSLNSFL